MGPRTDRRDFLRLVAAGTLAGCSRDRTGSPPAPSGEPYQGKIADMVLHAERPPNLEMPERFLAQDFTPNDAMFVRWHESLLPTSVDSATYRLKVGGHVERPLELSLDDLRARFPGTSLVAVNQCSGNGRSAFSPRVPGVQWSRGAVGNAKWTGVRLREVLAAAGAKAGAVEVTFGGLDRAPLESVPRFEKSLAIAAANGDEPLLAWAMNDAPLPMLNGYPLRLVVPGWYSTYWVKALEAITVLDHAFEGFWMKKAYRIPAGDGARERPDALSKDTAPLGRMNVRSLFVPLRAGETPRRGTMVELQGVAWDGGTGIARVEVSFDGGGAWHDARLESDFGPFAWRRWRAVWMPEAAGPATVLVRATSVSGERQEDEPRWNRSGYMRNEPERLDVVVA
ncbi:MAG TPA: molybdopterin-dependent oxidoreductase [Polyangiaceae bacterium]|jgi:DMSO/TMAO reductase YedYZ molybdopterin-dependent catalytic subunit